MPTFRAVYGRFVPICRIRDEADDISRARLVRFLGKFDVTGFSLGRVWQPLSEASLDALEAAAAEEVLAFRSSWRIRTENRARQAAQVLRAAA